MNMNQKISMREKVGYSLGDVAANLVFQMMMIFQLKFYTDIFGLDGAVAGSVLLIARAAARCRRAPSYGRRNLARGR